MKKGNQPPKSNLERLIILKRKNRKRLKELVHAREFYINERKKYNIDMANIDKAIKIASN